MPRDKDRAALEQALNEGRVTILGKRGEPSASKEFLLRLDDLPPSIRRLAIARACTLPWRDRPDEMPVCYEREHTRAMEEAVEERNADAETDATLGALMDAIRSPISELLLTQVAQMTPTRRYFSLIFAFATGWKPVRPPKWLQRDLAHAKWVAQDEYRAWRRNGWVD